MFYNVLRLSESNGVWFVVSPGYETPGQAKTAADEYSRTTGCRHRIQRVNDDESDAWEEREIERFTAGEYQRLPWENDLTPIPRHYAHISQSEAHLIAYTQTPEKGQRDIQTRISPTKYLSQYYPNLWENAPEKMKALAAMVGGQGEVEIIKSSEEIARAYVRGPSSCMSHEECEYETDDTHPAVVYGGKSDISLAILRRDDGRITARALVWEKTKTHSRVYGDIARLQAHLEALGYKHGSFEGAKLNRVENDNSDIICPYIDNVASQDSCAEAASVDVCENHLIIRRGGEYEASNTDGLLNTHEGCEICGDRVGGNLYYSESHSASMCAACYWERHSGCRICGEIYDNDLLGYVESENASFCEDCLSEHFFICEDCGAYHGVDNAVSINAGEIIVCGSCAEAYQECNDCKNKFTPLSLSHVHNEGDVCDVCAAQYKTCEKCGELHDNDNALCEDCLNNQMMDTARHVLANESRITC